MGVIEVRQQFNPSTQKVHYNPITKKAQLFRKYKGKCFCEYATDFDCDCFPAGKRPLYLSLVFTGLKFCSDDSDISCINGREYCLRLVHPDWEPEYWRCYYYVADGYESDCEDEVQIDFWWKGHSVTEPPGEYDVRVIVWIGIDTVFLHLSNDTCQSEYDNDLVKDDCGDPYGDGVYIGYGGKVTIINPCDY